MNFRDLLDAISFPLWTIFCIWVWALSPIELKPFNMVSMAWVLTAVMVWIMGLFVIAEMIWKRR